MELAVADVERDHVRCAALEEDVGEAARRGTDVEAAPARDLDAERVERVRELLAAPGDEARWPLDGELGRLVDLLARLAMAGHQAREDERLRLCAAFGEPALDQQDVEPLLHASQDVRAARPETMPASTEVSTGIPANRACARSAASSARTRAPSSPWVRT